MRDELVGDLKITVSAGHHQGRFLSVCEDVWIGASGEEELGDLKVTFETGKIQGSLLGCVFLIEFDLVEGKEKSDHFLVSLVTSLYQDCLFLLVFGVDLGSSLDERTGIIEIFSQTGLHQRGHPSLIP